MFNVLPFKYILYIIISNIKSDFDKFLVKQFTHAMIQMDGHKKPGLGVLLSGVDGMEEMDGDQHNVNDDVDGNDSDISTDNTDFGYDDENKEDVYKEREYVII